MWRRLQRLDERLMQRSQRARSPARDRVLVALTQAASYSRLWLLFAGLLATAGGRRGRSAAGRGLLAIAIAAVVANGPAKLLVRRRRPSRRRPPTLIPMPRSSSFPSGHSAAAFAFAFGVSLELPALAPVLVPLAGAVAYSRTHTGVHYPSDVAAGVAIGIGSAALAGRWRASWHVAGRESGWRRAQVGAKMGRGAQIGGRGGRIVCLLLCANQTVQSPVHSHLRVAWSRVGELAHQLRSERPPITQ